MIGVLAKESDSWAIREFFQLFKTPWKFCQPGEHYDLAIVTLDEIPRNLSADAIVLYNSRVLEFDVEFGLTPTSRTENNFIEWQDNVIPVYGNLVAFGCVGDPLIKLRHTIEIVGGVLRNAPKPSVRIGLDLFCEVALLLTQGQPVENARYPTLDIHISLLRAIMVTLGVPFIEVPPVPAGYDFMACLTHDVDFVGVRDHKLDHTMWGFLYRASVDSLLKAVAGRLSWSKCLRNWKAALSLPLVHLGLLEDFWLEFDRYTEIEKGLGSTYFFLPFKNVVGKLGTASAPSRRAAKYDVLKLKKQILELINKGCEVGLHGIDAWQDIERARLEKSRIRVITGTQDLGTRMHWLYWNDGSPQVLEEAGFSYDSTLGYNGAVGFRAGTTQPFCPQGTESLIELPLNIQDSAMFYSDRMTLSENAGLDACRDLVRSMYLLGGVITINWHTRSLSPERLWGDFYRRLLQEIQTYRVRFGTAREIVEWFRERRALDFDHVEFTEESVRVMLNGSKRYAESLPFVVRVYGSKLMSEKGFVYQMASHTDHRWRGEELLEIPYSWRKWSCTSDTDLPRVVHVEGTC
jgi:hypothetical protein